jgi:1,4-alpha-glucan branching enzyme
MGWMNDTLHYMSENPVHRRWHHRDMTFGLLYAFTEQFVLPLSHDEVVHLKGSLVGKMSGDEWQRYANLRSLYAWMWAYPGAPLLFMGGEFGQTSEWNAEVSLPWWLLQHDDHLGMQRLVVKLNELSVQWPTLWERDRDPGGFQWLDADDALHSIYSFARWSKTGDTVICIANFTPVARPGYRIGLPWAGEWTVLLNTDLPEYAGSNAGPLTATITANEDPYQHRLCSLSVDLPPLGVVWLAATSPG